VASTQHTASLDSLLRERDQMEAMKSESYSAEAVQMMARNKALTEELQAQHKRAVVRRLDGRGGLFFPCHVMA
jgi:hypothetical protein